MFRAFAVLIAAAPALLLGSCGSGTGGNATTPAAAVAGAPAPKGTTWVDTVSKTNDGGYLMGNPNAPIKLVEYGARTCPHCAAFDAEGLPVLKEKYIATGKVSYEFRDYPVHGPLDLAPILLGNCVDTATFFPLLDQMFQSQQSLLGAADKLNQAQVNALANDPPKLATFFAEQLGYLDFVKQRGIPEAKARACLTDKTAIDALAARTKTANAKYQIPGTPTFIINGEVVPDTADWAALEPVLKARGA